jgi:hypothetical protein
VAELEYLEKGSIGLFWRYSGTLPSDNDTPEYGRLYLDRHRVFLETIDESDQWSGPDNTLKTGTAILGQLPTDAVLILGTLSRGNTWMMGGHKISTQRYAAHSIVGGDVPLDRLRSSKVFSVRALFHSLADWGGIVVSEEHFDYKDGKFNEFTLKLSAPTAATAKLDGARSITIEPKWSVTGPKDRRVASIPIAIGCTSMRPVTSEKLLQPLIDIQNLLGMLFESFVAANKVEAVLDVEPSEYLTQRISHPMWNGVLMVAGAGAKVSDSMTLPIADLVTIGGPSGLARWVRLCWKYPRATEVAVSPVRQGPTRDELEILALGSALEYWVAANRHLKWAKKQPKGRGKSAQVGIARAIAGQAGKPFSSWVGDVERWCLEFSNTYNGLKHDPKFVIEEDELEDLVVSSRFLLLAVLLNKSSGTLAPSVSIFASHRLSSRGRRIRRRFATEEK